MSHLNEMPCPICEADIEVEYDNESLHAIEGCPCAVSWTANEMTEEDKQKFQRSIWQWISDYWADRAEEAQERKGDRD